MANASRKLTRYAAECWWLLCYNAGCQNGIGYVVTCFCFLILDSVISSVVAGEY
uniref:Uncharacterized protein n=1 Tax=Rhizophora mucronata TaxID=61149 RepID=A0A2P2NZG7_RHIMU